MSGSIDIPVVSKFDAAGINQAQSALGGFGKTVAGIGAAIASAFAIRAVVNFAKETILAAERAEQANNILLQVARTTGALSEGVTAATSRMIKFADSYELVIGQEAELIKETQAVLLSFKAVGASADEVGGVFDRATMAAFDMATVMKTDARSASVQLGKALENPTRGVTALAKAGTTFTDQQKEQIKALQESGDLLAAQEIVLKEVESQYGGAAEAGALWSARLQLAFDQVKDAVGAALLPSFQEFAQYFIEKWVPPLTKFFEEDFPNIVTRARGFIADLQPIFEAVGDGIREAFNIEQQTSLLDALLEKVSALGSDTEFVQFIRDSFEGFALMVPELIKLVPLMLELAETVVPDLVSILPDLISLLGILVDIFAPLVKFLADTYFWFTEIDDSLPSWAKGLEVIFDPIRVLSEGFREVSRQIQGAYDWLLRLIGLENTRRGVAGVQRINPPGGAGRAQGGRVTGGSPYLVGEVGPELFVPGRGGMIIPNDRLGGGGGANITINVNAGMGTNGAQVGEQIVNAIRRYERTSGPVFARA